MNSNLSKWLGMKTWIQQGKGTWRPELRYLFIQKKKKKTPIKKAQNSSAQVEVLALCAKIQRD